MQLGKNVYTILEMSKIVGVSTSGLRAWERRYNLLQPKRTPGGHRVYTSDDIKVYWYVCHLREESSSHSFLKELSAIGYDEVLKRAREYYATSKTQGDANQAVTSSGQYSQNADSRNLEFGENSNGFEQSSNVDAKLFSNQLQPAQLSIVEKLKSNNIPDAIAELENFYITSKTSTEFCDSCMEIMVAIGEAWHEGKLSAAAEHALTSRLKHLLLGLVYLSTPQKNPLPIVTAVCATLSGELHEIGLLRVAVYLKSWGCAVTYVGANTPLSDLNVHISFSKPHFLCLSVSQVLNPTLLTQAVQKLSMLIATKTVVVLGGSGCQNISKHLVELENIIVTESPAELAEIYAQIDSLVKGGKSFVPLEFVHRYNKAKAI